MSCRTCDHTMQNVAPELFWCSRCGALKFQYAKGGDEWAQPKSVNALLELCEAAMPFCAEDEGAYAGRLEKARKAAEECCLTTSERNA